MNRTRFWATVRPLYVLVLVGLLAGVVPPVVRRPEVRAAKTPLNAQMITVRDSNAPLGNGDFVGCSASPGLNTYYSVFIEVPSGTSRLTIDIYDADYGSTGGPSGVNRFDNRVGNITTNYSLFDPAGTSISLNTSLSDTGLNFTQGDNSAVGTNGPDTRAANNQWKNFFTRENPAAGHWELRIIQPGGGNSGVNPFGVAAHTLDPGANRDQNLGGPTTGRGLNMYFDPGIHLGPQNTERQPPITWNYYPYITSGCTCRANEFDWDASSGTGAITFVSRTGGYTRNIPTGTETLSPNGEWRSFVVGPWTTGVSAVDYGIWSNNITINGGSANHITYYIGNHAAAVPNTSGNNITLANWRQGTSSGFTFRGMRGRRLRR
ncbi:hypothetical protein [Chloracidobacterium aggregatum]|uniref:hypothetical protein n=1 Tax=Chloracidobacterium aggregatum TaxID=2851959 RepID=UPI001B8D174D|nr:hypothetical protein [Chloracidobacterium aggregatum]QUV86176.1 hypothetical protein J8C03_15450 [Chloracidobacterium sp. 2]